MIWKVVAFAACIYAVRAACVNFIGSDYPIGALFGQVFFASHVLGGVLGFFLASKVKS